MDKQISKLTWYVFITMILVASIGVMILFKDAPSNSLGLATSSFQKYAADVIGTKTGTTTVGVAFRVTPTGGQSATSTYVSKIPSSAEQVIYTAKVKAASSTANIHVAFLGSNDDYCATTNIDTAVDEPLTSDINWFDVSGHLLNLSTTATFTYSTSTLIWDTSGLDSGTGKEMT